MNYAISVVHKVKDLHSTQKFMTEVLEFTPGEQGDDFILMQNGALNIRLLLDENNSEQRLQLDVSCSDLDAAIHFYCGHGFEQLHEAIWLHTYRKQTVLENKTMQLTLFREYNEDELDIIPPLEVSLQWHEDALQLTQVLIKTIPVTFRDTARKKIVAAAEAAAVIEGLLEVDQKIAILAVIKATPSFQHEALHDELIKNGLDAKDYLL